MRRLAQQLAVLQQNSAAGQGKTLLLEARSSRSLGVLSRDRCCTQDLTFCARVLQGVMMGRRSILHFAAERTGENSWQIEVGGRVTSVATGKWLA
eukprot:SAG31_NODE_183_length_20987_cov_8.711078_8_plen_95_part_00